MATTIGHLALKISAQTDALKADMAKAEQITAKGGQKMAENAGKGATAWGSAFRGMFAFAAFQKAIRGLHEGVDALKRVNYESAAAAAGMEKFDRAADKIQGTLAKNVAPALGAVAENVGHLIDELNDLGDVYSAIFAGGSGGSWSTAAMERNLDKIRGSTGGAADMFGWRFERMQREQAAINIARERFQKEAQKFAAPIDQLRLPTAAYIEFADQVERRFLSADMAAKLVNQDFGKLLSTLGLAAEVDPFSKWADSLTKLRTLFEANRLSLADYTAIVRQSGEALLKASGLSANSAFGDYTKNIERLQMLRRMGAIDDTMLAQMVGSQAQQLVGDRLKAARELPRLMGRGSSDAFGAIQAFRSKPDEAKPEDVQREILKMGKEAQKKREEQIRIGKQILDATKKKPNIVTR